MGKSLWVQLVRLNLTTGDLTCHAKEKILSPYMSNDVVQPKKLNGYVIL